MPQPFVYSAEGDIKDAIMAALKSVLTAELITGVPTSDPLRLRKLIASPLQDDPTRVAPYVTYAPAWELGEETDERQIMEIGGPMLLQTHFRIVCGTPLRPNRDAQYKAIGELTRRVRTVLLRHYDLSGILAPGALVSADGTESVDAMSPFQLGLSVRSRIFGGENTWYGEGLLIFRYSFTRANQWT